MSKAGHNSKVQAGPVSADRLKSFIERIERLEEERKAIGGDIKDVYSEAKGVGYDVKTMRKIVSLRSMDAADRSEAETLLDVYKHALGMETGGPVTVQRAPEVTEEELEERAGRIVAEVDCCMDLVTDGQPPGIYAIQGLIGCSTGKASKLRGMVADRISRSEAQVHEMKSAEQEEAEWQAFRREEDEPRDDHPSQANDPAPQGVSPPRAPEAVEVTSLAGTPAPMAGEGAGTHSDDDLAIPAHLPGPSAANRRVGA